MRPFENAIFIITVNEYRRARHSVKNRIVMFFLLLKTRYLPIQKLENIRPNKSSGVTLPVISPSDS